MSPCGTKTAYNRHLRNAEEPCELCREASRAASRRRYADPEIRARMLARQRVQKREKYRAAKRELQRMEKM